MHFGWPSDVEVFAPRFPARFGRYAGKGFARWLADVSDGTAMITPINEMSFLAWAGGDVRCLNPFESARGVELKAQLVRATIEAIDAIRDVMPGARFLQPEPAIHIVPDERHPQAARGGRQPPPISSVGHADGRCLATLGGHPRYLDIIGVNFYPNNQFMFDGTTIERGDHRYRPFSQLLEAVWSRYRRPMIVSETGSEGYHRAPWLHYVCDQCAIAMARGCELHGVTLYPVINHPGWVDDLALREWALGLRRRSRTARGVRGLAEEVWRQAPRMLAARAALFEPSAALAIPA